MTLSLPLLLLPVFLFSHISAAHCRLYVRHLKDMHILHIIVQFHISIVHKHCHGYYEQMLEVIKAMMTTALKDNAALCFSIVTGCLRISKESIFKCEKYSRPLVLPCMTQFLMIGNFQPLKYFSAVFFYIEKFSQHTHSKGLSKTSRTCNQCHFCSSVLQYFTDQSRFIDIIVFIFSYLRKI